MQYAKAQIAGTCRKGTYKTQRTENEVGKHDFVFKQVFVMEIILMEGLRAAATNTVGTRNVCGEKWIYDYISELPRSELRKMNSKKSAGPFRFGNGKVVHEENRYSSQDRTD